MWSRTDNPGWTGPGSSISRILGSLTHGSTNSFQESRSYVGQYLLSLGQGREPLRGQCIFIPSEVSLFLYLQRLVYFYNRQRGQITPQRLVYFYIRQRGQITPQRLVYFYKGGQKTLQRLQFLITSARGVKFPVERLLFLYPPEGLETSLKVTFFLYPPGLLSFYIRQRGRIPPLRLISFYIWQRVYFLILNIKRIVILYFYSHIHNSWSYSYLIIRIFMG